MDRKGNYNYVVILHDLPPPPPLVCLLCACSDLISSLHRQGKFRERINTRGTSVVIVIAKSFPPPKADNTKVPTGKGIQHYPKIHLSVSSLHSRYTETSSFSLQPQLLSNAHLLFRLQTCLIFLLSLHPHFLRNSRLLFIHQLWTFFLLSLYPCFFSNACLLFIYQP